MGTNDAANRLILTYDDAVTSGAALGVGSGATVTFNGTAYTLEYHPNAATNIIRTGNEGGGTFSALYNATNNSNAAPVTITLTLSDNSTVDCSYDAMGALPVDLLSFTAKSDKRTKDKVVLEWATSSELNNSHFNIEHSTDGKNFTAIDKVEGMGTYDDLTEYSFTHEKAQSGDNFYRLKQVDFDGTFAFSPITQVSLASNQVSIKQTLVTDVLQLSFNTQNTTNIPYQIANARGQVLQSGILNTRNASQEISINELNDGIYFLHSVVNGELSVNKFVKF